MSKRKSIRNAVKAALLSQTAAGTNIQTSRYTAIFSETFPLILVYSAEEDAESRVSLPPQYTRTLQLLVSGIVKINDDVDDSMDDLAAQIETAMGKDPTFGIAMSSSLKKVVFEVDPQSESQLGAVHLNYEIEYVE